MKKNAIPAWSKELSQYGPDAIQRDFWTPTLTFATPGNVSVAYTAQVGYYQRVGNLITANCNIVTSAFTHTTASGELKITGLPYTAADYTEYHNIGTCVWSGITKATYTQITPRIRPNEAFISFLASGSGVAASQVTANNMPTGGDVILRVAITYFIEGN